MITLITLTQGNPIALKRTVDNVTDRFGGLVNEVVIGDMCIFEDDRKEINVGKLVQLPFNYLFVNGFGKTLNTLAGYATNDIVLYMNVGEVVDSVVNFKSGYNCWMFDHAQETHKWIRMYNRHQLRWSGRIHEEVVGNRNVCPDILFTMADTEKDPDPFKSQVYNDIKELVYFNQYITLIDQPQEIGATNQGWVAYAKRDYDYIRKRMKDKGARLQAMIEGDLQKYLAHCTEFQPQSNSDLIHFQ